MPRPNRITQPGYYHIVNRGTEGKAIFLQDSDLDTFLSLVDEIKKRFNITVHAFCLLSDHYHMLIQTRENNLSESMKFLHVSYSKYFNKKYAKKGSLWLSRFQANLLYDDLHSYIVAKYCERNPIKVDMVDRIDEYPYQSFYQWKNRGKYFYLLENSILFNMSLEEYSSYIHTDLSDHELSFIYSSPKIIRQNGQEKVLYKRIGVFFEKDKDINRTRNIIKAYQYGYSKSEIARFLHLSTTTISNIVNTKSP
jgi:REP element-mobilizing transposase RayT